MTKLKEKLKAIGTAVAAIEKQFGKGAIMPLGGVKVGELPVISTGSLGLDLALGVGGIPRGRVVEIYGPESSGKTTLTLQTIAEAQRAGGVCAFIDAEHALDISYAKRLGVRLEELLVSQPDCGEQALEIADQLVRSGAVDLIVIDSVAALTPRSEIEGEMGESHMGLQARLMSQALRKLTALTNKQGATVIFINQMCSPVQSAKRPRRRALAPRSRSLRAGRRALRRVLGPARIPAGPSATLPQGGPSGRPRKRRVA